MVVLHTLRYWFMRQCCSVRKCNHKCEMCVPLTCVPDSKWFMEILKHKLHFRKRLVSHSVKCGNCSYRSVIVLRTSYQNITHHLPVIERCFFTIVNFCELKWRIWSGLLFPLSLLLWCIIFSVMNSACNQAVITCVIKIYFLLKCHSVIMKEYFMSLGFNSLKPKSI